MEIINLENLGVEETIILNKSSRSGLGEYGLDSSGSGLGQVAGSCECGNELSASTKCWEFLHSL
jgi:hypothetical protein